MLKKFDITIVGGGILGVAHAYHALQAGLRVALLEKDVRPMSATVRNFGQIVPSGMDSKWQLYGRKSLEVYQQLQEMGDISVRPYGSVYLASDEEELNLLEELAQINERQGYNSILLNKAKCLAKYPGLKTDYVKGGLFFPQEITVDPRMAIHRIIALLIEKYDLAYFPNTLVTGVELVGDIYRILNNRQLPLQSEKLIVCSGSDFKTLFPDVFLESPLQNVKLQMLSTQPQLRQKINGSILTGWTIRRYESFQECPSFAAIKAREDANAFHRQWGIHILFKQTADGSVIIGDSHEYQDVDEAAGYDFQIDEQINQFIIEAAKAIYNLETYELQKTWVGIYSQCKDRDIFELEVLPNVHIITGIGGKGMTGSFGFASQKMESIIKNL